MILYKVVRVDGYARESVADCLVADKMGWTAAYLLCAWLRSRSTWEGEWWEVRPQNAKLWRGMEELV